MPTSPPRNPDLRPVVKALRRKFERECHQEVVDAVLSILPDVLKPNAPDDIEALADRAVRNMVAATLWIESEDGDIEMRKPPSPCSGIFARLVKIGRKYEKSLKQNEIDWAVSEMRGYSDLVRGWTQEAIGPVTSATECDSFADQFWEKYIEQIADDVRVDIADEHSPAPVIEDKIVQRPTPETPRPEVQTQKADRQKPHGYPEAVIAAARKDILAALPTDLIDYQTACEGLNKSRSTLGDWIRKGILKQAGGRSMLIAEYVKKCLTVPGYVEGGLRKAREREAKQLKAEQLKARRG